MTSPTTCSQDHSRLPYRGGVVVGCAVCRDAGLGPSDHTVRGRGWRCKSCGWTMLAPELWSRHELSEAHRQSELALGRRLSLQSDLDSLTRQVHDAHLERRRIQSLTKEELERRESEARAEINSRLRERRAELSEVESELRRRRDQVAQLEEKAKVLKPDESRESILEAAHAEVRAIREQTEKNAEEIKRRAEEYQLSEYDTRVRSKTAELDKLVKMIVKAKDDYAKELDWQAIKREDRALWNMAPVEVKEWFGYVRDLEKRTDYGIAVLLVRQESEKRIADLLSVSLSRVRDIRAGDGVEGSVLEFVRDLMGPPPEGWTPPNEGPTPPKESVRASNTSSAPGPAKPKADDSLVRAAGFRLYDEMKSVRTVSEATGRSVGWAAKLRKEWEAVRATRQTPFRPNSGSSNQ